jgi:pyruvate-formate lyase-activating enzyme
MPSIFEYLGILIFFYSNEHEPIHVHGKYDGFESKAEFYIVDGKVIEIKIMPIKGYRPLTGSKLKDFEDFLEAYSEKVVQKWIDYFVYHKDIEFEKINTRIK